MSNGFKSKAAMDAYDAEQRRKDRALMSDSYNEACSENLRYEINRARAKADLPPLPTYTPPADNGERNRRSDKVSDPVNVGIDATLNERGSRYGVFTDHAAITQGLKSVMKATPKWAALQPDQKEALEMIVHKVGRILNGDPDYIDSWHDISGYSTLVEKRLTEEQSNGG